MNVWDNNKYNPIGLILGQGYGGYFTDSLHMFDGLGDLTDGGWPEKDIMTGRFTRGHDTTATVPLLHGFGGLAIILYFCIKYAIFAKKSYMAFAVFPWILFTFYFNIQYAIIGISCLYAAEIVDSRRNSMKNQKRRMTKVCYFTSKDANDIRVFHEGCVSLVRAGYDVAMVCPNTEDKEVQGVHIRGVKYDEQGDYARFTKIIR